MLVLMGLLPSTYPHSPHTPSPWNGVFPWISTLCLELCYCEDIFQTSYRFLWVIQHFLEFSLACSVHLSNTPFPLSTFILLSALLLAYPTPEPSSYVLHVLYSSCLVVSPIPEWNVRIFIFVLFLFYSHTLGIIQGWDHILLTFSYLVFNPVAAI